MDRQIGLLAEDARPQAEAMRGVPDQVPIDAAVPHELEGMVLGELEEADARRQPQAENPPWQRRRQAAAGDAQSRGDPREGEEGGPGQAEHPGREPYPFE